MRRLLWTLGIALGGLLVLAGLLWMGYGAYVRYVVSASPATQAVVRGESGEFRLGQYTGGDQIPLAEAESPTPTAALSQTSPTPSPRAAEPVPSVALPTVSPTPVARPILPPTELKIPKIGVSARVVLADNENLPQFKGVGWLLGSGYPGFRGNVVLFGHLNGQYETFGRLSELASGDEVQVVATLDGGTRMLIREQRAGTDDSHDAIGPGDPITIQWEQTAPVLLAESPDQAPTEGDTHE